MTSLADISVGRSATVAEVEGDDAIAMRLMEMGITEGEVVNFIGCAPLGDPIEISIRGYRLSLRLVEAHRVKVLPP